MVTVARRQNRDQLFYQADSSVVNTALLMKEYVKVAFGTQSQRYKQIKGWSSSGRGTEFPSVTKLCEV